VSPEPIGAGLPRLTSATAQIAFAIERGLLDPDDAVDAFVADALGRWRGAGYSPEFDPARDLRINWHNLNQHRSRMRTWRDLTAGKVRQVVRRMAMVRRPANAILAEAHGVNGERGFPLLEREVDEIAFLTTRWVFRQGWAA
jgi:hypothetical protein